MNSDFIGIKSLVGELKLSHKRRHLGMTVTTEEFVLQKPHVNYHFKLENIISIMPYDTTGLKRLAIVNRNHTGDQVISVAAGSAHYRIRVSRAVLHNRSGIHLLRETEFVLPVHRELLHVVAEYGGLQSI